MSDLSIHSMAVHGTCDSKYNLVKQQFEKNMAAGEEVGASVAIVEQGELVVDLWAGYADKQQESPWQHDTIVNVFSATKGIMAICALHAADNGLLDLEKKVSHFWPEFACNGKSGILLEWLLSHRSGVAALREPAEEKALFDWDYMISRFARERPWWEPGQAHGYHMVSGGWMFGEVFHRALGCSVGEYLQSEIAQSMGLDFYIGTPKSEFPRIARLIGAKNLPENGRVSVLEKMAQDKDGVLSKSLINPPNLMTCANTDEWRQLSLPSATGHTNAKSLARLYGAVVADASILSKSAIKECSMEQSKGVDKVLGLSTRFGSGFLLQQRGDLEMGFGDGDFSFGHPGSGGSLGFADPEKAIGFGYAMNQMGPYLMVDPRARLLVEAMYDSLRSG